LLFEMAGDMVRRSCHSSEERTRLTLLKLQ